MNVICHVNCHVHIYGILPKTFIKTLEQYFNRFFLCGQAKALVKGGIKFSWEKFYLPKGEKELEQIKLILNLYTKAGSLWVAWVHSNLLKGRCLWTVKVPQVCSWVGEPS